MTPHALSSISISENGAPMSQAFDAYGLFLDYQRAHPEMRRGQCAFNAIHEALPAAADRFRGQRQDPFHNDAVIEPFLCGVQGLVSYHGTDPASWPPYVAREAA